LDAAVPLYHACDSAPYSSLIVHLRVDKPILRQDGRDKPAMTDMEQLLRDVA
jgi:hypothetical protein